MKRESHAWRNSVIIGLVAAIIVGFLLGRYTANKNSFPNAGEVLSYQPPEKNIRIVVEFQDAMPPELKSSAENTLEVFTNL